MRHRLQYELRYLLGNTPWDTNTSPPELLEFLQREPPGRAIDVGCGTGTNVLTMAEYGWQATGVDLSQRAIWAARRKARRSGHSVKLIRGSATCLTELSGVRGPYDLALDLGCMHALQPPDQEAYLTELAELLHSGATALLYCFLDSSDPDDRPWPSEQRVRQLFKPAFELTKVEHGSFGDRDSAWFTWRRS